MTIAKPNSEEYEKRRQNNRGYVEGQLRSARDILMSAFNQWQAKEQGLSVEIKQMAQRLDEMTKQIYEGA